MSFARVPAFRISLRITEEGSNLTFESSRGQALSVAGDLTRQNLAEQHRKLREDLTRFKQLIGKALPVTDWDRVREAMDLLYQRGRRLLFQLIGPQHWPAVHNLILAACPDWDQDFVDTPPPLVELQARLEDLVPIELLPLFSGPKPSQITGPESLSAVAHRFLGFSTIVRRLFRGCPLAGDSLLENSPRLPVKFFHHAELLGAQDELQFLSQQQGIDLEGPWPNEELPRARIVEHLAKHLWNPGSRFNGNTRHPPDQIQHFACHCNTELSAHEEHCLGLAHGPGVGHWIKIGELQAEFLDLAEQASRRADREMPLIFFNACGSSALDPSGLASFPHLLLHHNRNRGFIGAETQIPDELAGVFSRLFYTRLLQGNPLGAAIHAARWTILRRYNNPLGILYSVYANPDLRVRKPQGMQT
jgi:hypothetical protein